MASVTVVQGLDVSGWQGQYDWAPWKGKIGFGLAKATEGDAETDPDFGHNWDALWWLEPDHRLPRFAYGFFHASLDPAVQAAHLVATVKGHGLLPGDNFVLDLEETVSGSGENDGIPAVRCAPRAAECLRKINELAPGHRVLPYLNPAWARAGGSSGLGAWYLWLAEYGATQPQVPAPWQQWTFWQWTDSPVDRDRFNGSPEQLLAFTRMPDRR